MNNFIRNPFLYIETTVCRPTIYGLTDKLTGGSNDKSLVMWQANSVCLLRKFFGLMRMKMTHRQIERQLNQWNVKAESDKRESTTVTGLKYSGKTTF